MRDAYVATQLNDSETRRDTVGKLGYFNRFVSGMIGFHSITDNAIKRRTFRAVNYNPEIGERKLQ